jgi:hypothetical protein
MEPNPTNLTNWGDWLIRRATGAFGDFKMSVAIALIRTERFSRGWVDALEPDDIRRILARYKEHVTYWNIGVDLIQRELTELAEALGKNAQDIIREFDVLPARRLPPTFHDGSPIGGYWR